MTVGIATDHHGVVVKKELISYLEQREYQVINYGSDSEDPVDYPLYAFSVGEAIQKGEIDFGILICGSGIGMSIAANRHRAIRAALCFDPYMAAVARKHNNANVLCLGERVIGAGVAEAVVEVFLNETFEGGRHAIRVEKLTNTKD